MSVGLPRTPQRIAIRIYVVSVAVVLAMALALTVIVRLAWEPPHRGGPGADVGRYAASHLAERWGSPAALRAEVARLHAETREQVALYAWDGTPVAAPPGAPPLTLGPEERDALLGEGELRGGSACPEERCFVVAVRAAGQPLGFLVLDPHDRRGRLPLELLPVALVLVGLAIAAALLGRGLAGPLDRIARTARALGSGDLSARTRLQRPDELGDVARAFDDMADRIVGLLRAQTELIANVAHELRTPLARIRVALEIAADGDAPVTRESIGEIEEDLAELERLVEDVLSSARMQLAGDQAGTGDPRLHRADLSVEALVAGAADRLRQRQPGRRLELDVAPGLPTVHGDRVLLRRALDNLVDNARKYSDPASTIRIGARAEAPGVVLQVVDSGEGLAPEDLARLFTPFFRADPSRTRATGGVGLGLALARRIVEAHGGTLTARSQLGVGTTMTIALPAGPPP